MEPKGDYYSIETYIQTLLGGDKRIVVHLFKTEKKLVKRFFIPIKEEEFYKDD